MKQVYVASKKDVPTDQLSAVEVEGKQIALCQAYGHYYAVSEFCTHGEASLADEGQMEDNCIVCSMHGGMFDPRTGQALELPAYVPLETYKVIEKGDDLYIELDEE